MKKSIIILTLLLLSFLAEVKARGQSSDSLAYSLVNYMANMYYERLSMRYKDEKPRRKIEVYIESKIIPYSEPFTTTVYQDLLMFLIRKKDVYENIYNVYSGKYKVEGLDTLRWGSLVYQGEHPPITEWDSCMIDSKFMYTRDIRQATKEEVGPFPQIPVKKYWIRARDLKKLAPSRSDLNRSILQKKGANKAYVQESKDDLSDVPHKYGVHVGYPLFFDYKGEIYGFITLSYDRYRYSYYVCKWSGESWDIVDKEEDIRH